MLTRRQLLHALPTTLLAPALLSACKGEDKPAPTADPTPTRAPEPPMWVPEGAVSTEDFLWGVVAGDPTPTSARLHVRARAAALTLVVVEAQGEETWAEVRREEGLSPTPGAGDDTGTASVELTGLTPDTAYAYCFYAPDGTRSVAGRFRTALAADGWRVITFGVTSCLGTSNPTFPCLQHAAADQLDTFFLLGDTVYADGARTIEDYRAVWATALQAPGLNALAGSTAVVATWDDHEVDNGWRPDDPDREEQIAAALLAWREAIPMGPGQGAYGIWRSLSLGAVADVFVLDCRGERQGEDYLSPEQMAWLKAGLAASTARFELILNSVPITDISALIGDFLADDRWQGYPVQRAEILGFIEEQGIEGVLWLGGDFHFGGLTHVDPAGGVAAGAWEVFCGPAGSKINVVSMVEREPDPQFPFLVSTWNYVRCTADPGTGVIRVEFVGDDGAVIQAAELEL